MTVQVSSMAAPAIVSTALDLLDAVVRALVFVARGVVIAIAFFITISMILGVFFRFVLNSSLGWTDEVSSLLLAVMMFIAVGIGFHDRQHIGVGALVERLPPHGQRLADAALHLVSTTFFAIVGWVSIRFAEIGMGMTLATIELPRGLFYWAAPIGCGFAALVCLNNAVRMLRGLDKPRFGGVD
ncbi:TRAP transporter small permease [Ancylobacter mangrovi]|uniref:TRAP transporter small permease protein n=1 Tax=Ancylobacter mangrovi TaxID=2972472 RepID=A0A9X2T3D3_9HYPH|nr:TRAP transporter small permease [Ancylobacter mangrovi]MCS0497225.1 TRAP transporter small permease [Ancylobacter mangrovi]MCS0505050.1 TRAP transporter small permease [Ancylobacter mangrovi]